MEHVVGPQAQVRTISIEDMHNRKSKSDEICRAADEVDHGDGVVVVTDIFGGSPSNLALPACAVRNRVILYGANLPMLIKLAKLRHLPAPNAAALAAEAGRKYIDSYNVLDELSARRAVQ